MQSTAPNHKVSILLLAFSIIIIIGLTYFIATSLPKLNKPQTNSTISQVTPTNNAIPPVSLNLSPASTTTPQTYNVTTTSPINYHLNAFQLHLTFDPQLTEITNITPGKVWDKTIILSKTINTTTGKISLSAGREPQAQQTTNPILITITLSPNSTNTLKLLSTSQLALAGENQSPIIIVNE